MADIMLDMDSRLADLYRTPVGHDTLQKLLFLKNIPESFLLKGPVSHLKLSSLQKLTKAKFGPGFLPAFVSLANSESGRSNGGSGPIRPDWWKEAVFYQIYPRTFCDTNGDGIGDLQGILRHLDDLASLGVNALWLSPVYDSPNDDNGYDIRDYRKILREFGTMEDFDLLLAETHARKMHLIMDLVVNHTSDEHRWFSEALSDPSSGYRGYYFFRRGNGTDVPPNNWKSFFSGPAWKRFLPEDVWALHLFSQKQMDLNWDNPKVRDEVASLVDFWLDKGVDGFRMDVISYISKEEGLPDGDPGIGSIIGFTGMEHYFYGPHLHEYLRELHKRAFAPHHAFSVGETPGLGMETSRLLTDEKRGELDMIFSFDHLETPGHFRFDDYEYDLNYYKKYITDWSLHYGSRCRMSLFFDNHDNPRMVSKISRDPQYRKSIACLLAVMQMTLPGTPFIYQGDEMGLVNYPFRSIEEITDVESRNLYQELLQKMTPEEAFREILSGTREHARVLLPWGDYPAGFPAHLIQRADPEITEAYRFLIALRRESKTLLYGKFEPVDLSKDRFIYKRIPEEKGDAYAVECNLSKRSIKARFHENGYVCLFPQEHSQELSGILQPYESRIFRNSAIVR